MSKAEEFIREHTRNCSNQYDLPEYFENGIERLKEYQPWLTPDQARRAVEIAREEMYECLENPYKDYIHSPTKEKLEAIFGMDVITYLKRAMKDE